MTVVNGYPAFDSLVVGSGVAGCTTALELVERGVGRVGLITKGGLGVSTTDWAQGGIAAALSEEDDSIELHFEDTLRAGGGLCDLEATRVLVGDGPDAIRSLEHRGAILDRDEQGELARSREGGHSVPRVVHAGGMATGAEVIRALVSTIERSDVVVIEASVVNDLVFETGSCRAVSCVDDKGAPFELESGAVVLATGGAGQLYSVTTNPDGATGDGVALAIRAGVPVADLEFVQFHPTALAVERAPRPLLSEGLRGYGALLVDERGERFVDELAPRDVVSRAIITRMVEHGTDHVYLDARSVADFARRFPTLAVILERQGLDAAKDLLPVAPAAHYLCGGVLTDLSGHTAARGLYAVGETACTGAEGANRLASNSLLEGLVFGRRVAEAIAKRDDEPRPDGALGGFLEADRAMIPVRSIPAGPFVRGVGIDEATTDAVAGRAALARALFACAGVVRDEEGLTGLAPTIRRAAASAARSSGPQALALRNLATLARSLAAAALVRRETRGAHARSDAPERDDDHFRVRLAVADPRWADLRA